MPWPHTPAASMSASTSISPADVLLDDDWWTRQAVAEIERVYARLRAYRALTYTPPVIVETDAWWWMTQWMNRAVSWELQRMDEAMALGNESRP